MIANIRFLIRLLCVILVILALGELFLAYRDYPVASRRSARRLQERLAQYGDDFFLFERDVPHDPTLAPETLGTQGGRLDCPEHCFDPAKAASYPDFPPLADKKYRVLLLGCSASFGSQIPDEANYAWLLNSRLKNIHVENRAFPGLGTFECLRMQRRALEQARSQAESYDLVIYAFLVDHMHRNAGFSFFQFTDEETGESTLVRRPYVTVNNSNSSQLEEGVGLVEHPAYLLEWPGMYRSRLCNFVGAYVCLWRALHNGGSSMEIPIFNLLIQQMRREAQAGGADFAILSLDNKTLLSDMLAYPHGKEVADVAIIDGVLAPYVKGEAGYVTPSRLHPSEKTHAYWAKVLEEYLGRRFKL